MSDLTKLKRQLQKNPKLINKLQTKFSATTKDERTRKYLQKRQTKLLKEKVQKEKEATQVVLSSTSEKIKSQKKSRKRRLARARKKYGKITRDQYLESLKYLDQSDLSEEDRNRYQNMVDLYLNDFNQLNEDELSDE